MNREFWKNERGMTMIEVLIVVFIIGILSAIAIPHFGKVQDMANDKKMLTNLRNLAVAIGIYKVDNDNVPDANDVTGLIAILKADQGSAAPLVDTDPWGHSYDYIRDMATNSYTLRCRGKDGVIGNRADENNFNANNDTVVIDGVFVASHQGTASIAH